ncbi:MAG: ABC transporter permease [Nitrososphaerota archaeon]|jgi:ABC-type antimicrobial peptide transport system permease subunit|nr:ABC transporter permease [Nitrososphaerota archaeon]
MSLLYPVKHVFRNWKLFAALLIGVALAATFFAGIGVKVDVAAEESVNKQISYLTDDMSITLSLNQTNLPVAIRNMANVEGVKSVDVVARAYQQMVFTDDENVSSFFYAPMISFQNNSRINDEWLNRPEEGIRENTTYVLAGTTLAKNVAVGDVLTVRINFFHPKYWNTTFFDVDLRVAGFAELTDEGYMYSTGNYFFSGDPGSSIYQDNLLIIGWDSTFMKLWRSATPGSTFDLAFSINVDRHELISPYNIPASVTKINLIADNIQNSVLDLSISRSWLNNLLSNQLSNYNYDFQNMLLNFFLVSFPIFFAAWYLGYTVSAVSFNIRRREIGLLSTKGLSSGQIQRMFLAEALVIGIIGGFLGIVGGLILNQYYAGVINLRHLFSSGILNPIVAIATLVFAVVLAVTSVYLSSRKASRIPAIDALRDYMPPDKPTRKIFPIIAIILGGYKIVIFLLGVNISQLFNQWNYAYGNMFLSIASRAVVLFDSVMTFIGPLLFFWGFTALLIRDSTKFQVVATKIASVMGELGALAAKNVRRNPARLAAVAFLIALIIGLSVQVTAQMASQEDYIVRNVRNSVGADVSLNVVNATQSQEIIANITQSVPGIRNASIECSINALSLTNQWSTMEVKTIEPEAWAVSAYYEDSWFTGSIVEQMINDLKNNNNTIILDRSAAKQYGVELYDTIKVDFISGARQLKVVGFFGPEPSEDNGPTAYAISGGTIRTSYYSRPFCSYVPRNLFNMTEGSDIYLSERPSTKILISLESGVNGTEVAKQIYDLDLDVYRIDSFETQWQRSVNMDNLNTYSDLKNLELQSFGLIFAVLSASVGTALIAIVGLKERSREATLMSVRGLSYRQLVWMFLMESIAIITFAVILGIVVGVIIAYGSIATANAPLATYSLVIQRLIFPPNAVAVVGTYIALIYASTIGAVLVMASQYVTKLEKMVRTR